MKDDKILFSTQDVMKKLGMSKTTILKAVSKGDLKCLKYGNKFYFKEEHIEDFIKKMEGNE